ncbi:LysR family hca operon transcriptional activator [Nitrobacteraceae bacterium AZCC 2161]
MELRHLRYFVAIAEEGNVTQAAARRLRTSQPSLSRQLRDLETELGVTLLLRGPRGVQLTAAGRAFLDPARAALLYVEAATTAAQRATKPEKAILVLGFLAGYEMIWLPDALRILREDFPNVEIVIRSQSSPELAEGLLCGKIDIAFLRPDKGEPVLTYRTLTNEPLIAAIPRSHPLATSDTIRPQDLMGHPLIIVARETAPYLRAAVESYAARSGAVLQVVHEPENLTTAISLIASTGIASLLALSAVNLFPPSIIARPLTGEIPTVALAVAYSKTNPSDVLSRFLERIDDLTTDVMRKSVSARLSTIRP